MTDDTRTGGRGSRCIRRRYFRYRRTAFEIMVPRRRRGARELCESSRSYVHGLDGRPISERATASVGRPLQAGCTAAREPRMFMLRLGDELVVRRVEERPVAMGKMRTNHSGSAADPHQSRTTPLHMPCTGRPGHRQGGCRSGRARVRSSAPSVRADKHVP